MKNKIICLFIFILITSGILASASIIDLEIEPTYGKISITITIGNYEIKSTEHGDDISVENFGRLLIPGKPNLPSKIFTIAIPPGAELVDIDYEATESLILPGIYNIPPVELPSILCMEDPAVYAQEVKKYNENYNEIYGSNENYPSSNLEFVRSAGYRKYNLVDVRIIPFNYCPLSGQLIYYPEITIHVRYTFPKDFNYNEVVVDDIAYVEQLAEKIILNYDDASSWYKIDSTRRETYDYIIITLDSLTSKVTALAEWEESKGRNPYVVTTSWIDSNYDGLDLAEKIRNFLRDKYPSEKWGILDVCLIGDYDDVPMRLTAQDVGYGEPMTDYYFAELSKPDNESWDRDGDFLYGEDSDHIDFYAEVNVGRIPWSEPDIVQDICEKSIAYEQNNDPAFKKNILLIGAFFWPDTDNAELMEAKVDQDWMSDWTMTRIYEEEQSLHPCDYDLSYDNVRNVWSDGTYGFVNWAGHGSPTECYEYFPEQPFVDTATCNYLNDDYPAIIFADACSNSHAEFNNIGKMMMKQGAVGFLGPTEDAFGFHNWSNPYNGSSQSLDYFFTTCCTSTEYTQGQAHQWALLEMYKNELWYYTKYEMFEWGSLWGNPDLSMGFVSIQPEIPSKPEGPKVWTVDFETEFESTTTDPDGHDIFYKFDWGDGNESGWVGPYASGQKGKASYTWTKLGEFQVKVIARDQFSVLSQWSEPANITIIENGPPVKPKITGPIFGLPKRAITFTVSTDDPEFNDLYYTVTWGDGNYDPYKGPYASGDEVPFIHSWSEPGDYTIIVRARDEFGAKSKQNIIIFTVAKSRTRMILNPFLLRILDILKIHYPLLEQFTKYLQYY